MASRRRESTDDGGHGGLHLRPTERLYQSTGSTDRRFLYDGVQAIGEYDGSGALARRFVPGAGLDDYVLAYEGSGVSDRRWLLSDERQSVIALTDGSGVASAINTYDDYGVPSASNTGRFQYTGQMWLPDAQLYHYRARAYAPQIGRFLQTDPMGYGAGANLYAYVGADPVNLIDPFGLEPECVVGGSGNCHTNDDPLSRCGVSWGGGCITGQENIQRALDGLNVGRLGAGRQGGGGGAGSAEGPSSGATQQKQVPSLTCESPHSWLGNLADGADAVSEGAGVTALVFGGVALVTSETIVGGVTFGVLAGISEGISVGASVVGFTANVFDGRIANAGLDLFGIAFGGAAGLGAKSIHPAVQLVRNAGAAAAGQGASSICQD